MIHTRALNLIDCVMDLHHCVAMDKLYTSVNFYKACFNHPNKVLIDDVIRKVMRGVSHFLIHEEQKIINRQEKQLGKKKAAIFLGNSSRPNMICTSVYDTKPVHFISMSCEKIGWVVKEMKVWSKS